MNTRQRLLLVLGLLLLPTAACTQSSDFQTPDVTVREAPAHPSDLVGTLRLIDAVAPAVARLRSDCLQHQGRDEIHRALSLTRPPNSDFVREPLNVQLIEFGPADATQAVAYGMAGTELLADLGDTGGVISKDPHFDLFSDKCDAWIYGAVAPGLAGLQARAAEFADVVNAEFIGELGTRLVSPMKDRVSCVRNAGYRGLTVEKFLSADSMLEILQFSGVTAGHATRPEYAIPNENSVPDGKVHVFAPPPAKEYVPSEGEIRFATVFAECGQAVEFPQAVEGAVTHARRVVTNDHGASAVSLHRDLQAALLALHGQRAAG